MQFVMIDVLRVKIKVTLCMLDKFSYFCHLYHVQFNIKTSLGNHQSDLLSPWNSRVYSAICHDRCSKGKDQSDSLHAG